MKDKKAIIAFGFNQNIQRYLSVVLTHEQIDNNSEVLIYGEHPQGYQREPEASHYNKIKDYILKTKDFLLPTSIVLAIDEKDLNLITTTQTEHLEIDVSKFPSKRKVFRIVDGQHRIIAIREAIVAKPNLKAFCFNAIILITNPNKRSVEMEVFYNINSKGKRLKVDLIELARFNYRIIEKSLNEKEINEHIAIQVAYFLNEKTSGSVWSNAIKFGIHDEEVIGIIGVNAFRESISGIVDAYLKIDEDYHYKSLEGEKLIQYSKQCSKKIADFLHTAWDNIIKEKWKFCFKEAYTQIDLFLETKKIYYNPKYYIQRTMGAKALNGILSSIVIDKKLNRGPGLNKTALKEFEIIIKNSKITNDDWAVGGAFGGYSSESGFKKVSQFILNHSRIEKIFRG